MSYDMEAELNYFKALDKEKKRVVKALKTAGFKCNGFYGDTEQKAEFEKTPFVLDITIS